LSFVTIKQGGYFMLNTEEYDMATSLSAPQPRANVLAGTTDGGRVDEPLARDLRCFEVTRRLLLTPRSNRVRHD